MNATVRRCCILAAAPLWWFLSWIVPKRSDYIAVNSFPDFDDTARAIGHEASRLQKVVVVLTMDQKPKWPEWVKDLSIKVAHRYSPRGIWLYHRSKYIVFTHGLFPFWKTATTQTVINVWHGMPIKKIGLLDGKHRRDIERFNFTIADNERFRQIIASAFGISQDKILISAHPRMDGMLVDPRIERLHLPSHRFLTVWLPTYRRSFYGDVRVDGNFSKDIFSPKADLSVIDLVLKRNECVCLVKPHPMSNANKETFSRYSNIIYIDENILRDFEMTLYQLLGQSDFLITDVSSVYFDYKHTKRPIIIYCPDFSDYETSRGFVAPIGTLIDEKILTDEHDLAETLNALFPVLACRTPDPNNLALTGGVTKSLLKMVGVA